MGWTRGRVRVRTSLQNFRTRSRDCWRHALHAAHDAGLCIYFVFRVPLYSCMHCIQIYFCECVVHGECYVGVFHPYATTLFSSTYYAHSSTTGRQTRFPKGTLRSPSPHVTISEQGINKLLPLEPLILR